MFNVCIRLVRLALDRGILAVGDEKFADADCIQRGDARQKAGNSPLARAGFPVPSLGAGFCGLLEGNAQCADTGTLQRRPGVDQARKACLLVPE